MKRKSPVLLAWACLLMLSPGGWAMTTRLAMRGGVPVMLVNGKPLAPMGFWGHRHGAPVTVGRAEGAEWQEVRYSFRAPVDDPDATIHFHLGLRTGTVWIDDVALLEAETPDGPATNVFGGGDFELGEEGRDEFWTFFVGHGAQATWHVDDSVVHRGRHSLRVRVTKASRTDWHVHVYTKNSPLRKGRHYTVSFWIRTDRATWPINTNVMRLGPYRVYATGGVDSFSKTAGFMAANGFHIYTMGMPLPWPEPGEKADYSVIDGQMRRLVEDDPEALFFPRIGVEPPGWWAEAHPDEMLRWENGKTSRWASVASELWRRDAKAALGGLVGHLEKRWSDHILGYHPAAQNSAEWYYPLWYHRDWGLMNFSPAFARGFRAWLAGRYRAIDAVNEAWGTAHAAFDEIRLPTAEERKTTTLGVFRDPARERRMIDFTIYQQEAMVTALDEIARAIKDACGGRKLVFAFYGYTIELVGCPCGITPTGHLRLGWLLERGSVDVICGPSSYHDRQAGGSGPIMAPAESINFHGRVWLNEDDTRTHLSAPDAGFGRTASLDETRWVHARNFAVALAHRSQMWFMDQDAGWLAGDAIWANLARLRPLYDDVFARPSPNAFDAALIVDEESFIPLAYGRQLTGPLVYEMRASLNRMGTTHSIWLLSDFIAGNVPEHKVYFFVNAFWLDAAARKSVRRRLRDSGSTAVWFYAPGFLDTTGSTDTMQELTGLAFERLDGKRSTRMRPVETERGYLAGVPREPMGPATEIEPVFAVQPGQGIDVLARYVDGGEVAMAARRHDGHVSIFVGSLSVTPQLLGAICRWAGAHRFIEPGDVVYADDRMLSLTACPSPAARPNEKTLTLKRPARVTDVITGRSVAERTRRFTLRMREGETRVLRLTYH